MFCKTKGNVNPQGKPRVYFTCHPDDFELCFKKVSDDIFKTHDCAIYYTEDMTEEIAEQDKETDLSRNNLFVIPVTQKLLNTQNRTMNKDYPFAIENHIPVLPIMMETGIDDIYSQPDKFGELQYLYPYSSDLTEISYEEKLKKYLESVLISDEMAKRVRAAFDAYIFLSYRKKDRRYANELMRLIHNNPECRDIAIWFDEFLTPGESFKKNIEKILDDCNLFALLVTPQLLEKVIDENGIERDNYVLGVELPEARKRKEAKGTEIFAVEMEETDAKTLRDIGIDNYVNAKNSDDFRYRLLESISKIAITTNNTPEHNFLIGLAYLDGIDVEVDRKRAVELIADAAEQELPEALIKLIVMYTDGIGVIKDQSEVLKWSQKLSDYYFKKIFTKKGEIKSKDKLNKLFKHYKDKYWNDVTSCFLVKVDEVIPFTTTKKLYDILLTSGICEYTLLFDICKKMNCHQEETQILLTNDILRKSASGIYPPYGPLFWYVPEYELYEALILALETMKHKDFFTKALALTRDVCWIFGHYNTVDEITNCVNGETLFNQASLTGVRYGLCELFYTGKTDSIEGSDVYPRCFNIKEAKNWKEDGCGVLGRMLIAFEDELGLYKHEMYNELDDEWIGIVATKYDTEYIETVLPQKSCKKLCGLFLSPSREIEMKKLAINDKHIRVIYIPETSEIKHKGCFFSMNLKVNVSLINQEFIYFYKKVILPPTITKIDKCAFEDCNMIESIVLPESIVHIDSFAFANCCALSKINFPEGIKDIGVSAFGGCSSLLSIVLPNTISFIGYAAFSDCISLSSIVLPDRISTIGWAMFFGCSSLASVSLPKGITEIGASAFENCISLTSINIPKGTIEIGAGAFWGCKALFSIQLSNEITEIKSGLFKDCTSLSSIKLPDNIKEIGWSAFEGCSSLGSIVFPKSTKKIGENAFDGCGSLSSICFSEEITEIGIGAFKNCTSLVSCVLPNSLEVIGENVFKNCNNIKTIYNCPTNYNSEYLGVSEKCILKHQYKSKKTIIVPNKTIEIKNLQYEGMRDVVQVKIAKTVIKIGMRAFENCSSILSVELPNGVKAIGEKAFKGCNSMSSITLPDSISNIGWGAFEDCRSLKSVDLPCGISDVSGSLFKNCSSLVSISVPNDVVDIGWSSFEGCSKLRSIEIPDNISIIGGAAFKGCESLESIIIPNSINRIIDETFCGCSSLNSIIIPNSVTEIGASAFKDCIKLKSIELHNNITIIDSAVFKGCQSLDSISLPDGISEIKHSTFCGCSLLSSIKIPQSITQIEQSAFEGCIKLCSIELSDEITKIEGASFKDCESLRSISLPNNISIIEEKTFYNCKSLPYIVIPKSVRKIGDNAFGMCVGLEEITISRRFEDDLPRIFNGVDLSNVKIYWI